jgi:hypothetical protein
MAEVVYLIGPAGSSVAKIGRAKHVERRMTQLQPGHPAKLAVLWTTPGGSLIEGELHRRFDGCRVFGEWFDFGSLDPVATVDAAAEEIKAWWASVPTRMQILAETSDPLRESALAGLRDVKRLRGAAGTPKRDIAEATEGGIVAALEAKIGPTEIAKAAGVSDTHVRSVRRKHNLPPDSRYSRPRPTVPAGRTATPVGPAPDADA